MNAGNIEFKTQKQASMCSNVQMCDWWGWIKCLFHSLIPSNCQKDSRTDSAFICHLCCDDDEHEEAAVFPVCSSPINPYLDVWKRSSAIRRDHFIKTTNSFNLHELPDFMLSAVCMGKPVLCCVFSELNWDWHKQSIWNMFKWSFKVHPWPQK